MIDGESSMSDLPEADGLVVVPHVGALVLLAKDKEVFYGELECLLKSFVLQKQLEINESLFEEILIYQNLRFPGWPQQSVVEHTFQTNIPRYFQLLTDGHKAPLIQNEQMTVSFRDHMRKVDSFAGFAASMVRGGLTVDLCEQEIHDKDSGRRKSETLANIRREMEQKNLDKLSSEYQKLAST